MVFWVSHLWMPSFFLAGFFWISPSVWPNSGFWCCVFLTLLISPISTLNTVNLSKEKIIGTINWISFRSSTLPSQKTHTHTHTKHTQTHLFPKEKVNTLFFYKSVKEEKTQVPNTLYIFSFCFQNSFTKGKGTRNPMLNFFPPKKNFLSEFPASGIEEWDFYFQKLEKTPQTLQGLKYI
jgi:hypothetical protein